MQQMTNILLSSADGASSKKMVANGNPQQSVEGDNFSAALEKASKEGATAEQGKVDGEAVLSEVSSDKQQRRDIEDSYNTEATKKSDNVSQVFAQINLANNFSSSADDPSIAADGEGLPSSDELTDELAILSGAIDETKADDSESAEDTELTDEIMQALSLHSGISEKALNEMPETELKALLAQSKILDADGALLAQYAIAPAPNAAAMDNADELKISPQKVDTHSGEAEAKRNSTISEAKPFTHSAVADGTVQQPVAAKSSAETRDILGKEGAIQAGTATVNLSEGASKNAEIENSKNGKLANNANNSAAEQLKGAELSVRLTPIQMGLEANLASGNEELSTQDIKTVSGLQAHNLQIQQSLTRVEPQQIQLALKQHADQATQMQEMIQRFSPVMKQQLMTMVSQGVQQAEIRLDPAELGSMMVRIQVQGDSTQVQFQVSQHQTRDLVEQAMPRLREMLAEQGMQLTDGQVSQGDRGNDQSFQGDRDGQGNSHSEMDEISAEELIVSANQATTSASGIDYYA